jgi:hypothetical protein
VAGLLAQLSLDDVPGVAAALGGATPDVAVAALRRFARQAGAAALPLLEGLLRPPASAAVLAAALEALGEVPTPAAADLAAAWAEEGPDDAISVVPGRTRETRRGARRALYRLSQAGVQPRRRPADGFVPERTPPERVRRALMSAADAEGTRLLYLLIDPPLGGLQLARIIASDGLGLLRFETFETSGRQFERYVTAERPDRELALAEVPPAYGRWLVAEAVAASRAADRPLPPTYLSYREALLPPDHVPIPPIEDEPLALDVRYRPDLVEQGVELLDLAEFRLWQPTAEAVAPLAEEWRTIGQGPLALPPAVVTQRRDAIVDRVVDLLTGPGGVAGLRRRLEDNALVLLRRGETAAARLAMAGATRLDPDDPTAPHRLPMLRTLAERALAAVAGPPDDLPGGPVATLPPVPEPPPPEPDVEPESGLRRRPSGLILPR